MEIIGISNNKKQCINTIKLIDNQINSLIDYGNLSNLIVNDRKYILLNNIIFSFKTNTLNDEINLYKNNVSESKLNKIKELFDLESELYNKNIYEMSSGQLRMCYIFINILFNNELIILNNPTEDLDYKNKQKMLFILKELKKENNTILIISKDIEFIHKISDNVIILKDNIINQGNKYDVFTNENYNQFKIPKTIEFSKRVYELKNIKIGYRDDIKDLMKDIYRYVK